MTACWFQLSRLRRLACCCSFGLLVLVAGCEKHSRGAAHVSVSGQVLFRGKPLPGGQVTFVTVNGGFANSAPIDENGKYHIDAPVGEVEIGVDNQMLQSRGGAGAMSHPKAPGSEAPAATAIKGRYVPIPTAYADPHTSGLKYTVTAEPQTHDIELPATPPSSSGAPRP